jgi:AcrR family transcriptional regulator
MNPKVTKEAILKVAEEVFAEKNFNGATMQDIAERLNIKKPALYYHFKSKKDIYNSLILTIYERLEQKVREPFKNGRDLREKLANLITHLVDFWAEHPLFPKIITQEVLSNGDLVYSELIPKFWLPMFQDSINELKQNGQDEFLRSGIDLPLLMVNIFGMSAFYFFIGPILNNITGEDYYTPEKIEKLKSEMVALVFQGIGWHGERRHDP